jgi:hypothetical protein
MTARRKQVLRQSILPRLWLLTDGVPDTHQGGAKRVVWVNVRMPKACPVAPKRMRPVPDFQSIEKLVPQPQADLAFGLRTAKWLPISSSV